MTKEPNGIVLYHGPSMLDGKPIIVIATGLRVGSTNGKTGKMVQIWIMPADVSPVDAIHSGVDATVCGDCRHRGVVIDGRNVGRSCYVNVWQAPRNVWDSWHRKKLYPTITPQEAAELFRNREVRLGAYGDPAAVPILLWDIWLMHVAMLNGYTHQWRRFPQLKRYCMASCDSGEERIEAVRAGWRTFRVRGTDDPLMKGEFNCPMSKEAGYKLPCIDCKSCGGLSAKNKASPTIIVHGTAAHRNAHKTWSTIQ
jgi:hypothetical protein